MLTLPNPAPIIVAPGASIPVLITPALAGLRLIGLEGGLNADLNGTAVVTFPVPLTLNDVLILTQRSASACGVAALVWPNALFSGLSADLNGALEPGAMILSAWTQGYSADPDTSLYYAPFDPSLIPAGQQLVGGTISGGTLAYTYNGAGVGGWFGETIRTPDHLPVEANIYVRTPAGEPPATLTLIPTWATYSSTNRGDAPVRLLGTSLSWTEYTTSSEYAVWQANITDPDPDGATGRTPQGGYATGADNTTVNSAYVTDRAPSDLITYPDVPMPWLAVASGGMLTLYVRLYFGTGQPTPDLNWNLLYPHITPEVG